MAELYWCPCIVVGSVRYYLPPWISLRDTWGQNVEILNPPYGDRAIIAEVYDNQATQISLQATGIPVNGANARNVLDWMQQLRSQLRGRTFSLYLFSDRGYENCALTSNVQHIPLNPLMHLATDIDIVSETTSTTALPTLDFPGGYAADYPYAHMVGRPQGQAAPTGGIAVIQHPRQTHNGIFIGQVESATPAADAHRYTVGGGTNSIWTLENLQITSADPTDAAGDTTIVVSTVPPGGSGPSVQATVAPGQKFSTLATSGIQVTAGATLYVYATAAGGHGAVSYEFQLKG